MCRNDDLMDAVRTRGELPPSVDDDTQNALIYAESKDRPLAEVLAAVQGSWDRFRASVDACSEEDLRRPHPYVPVYRLADTVPANGYGHVGEHLTYWYLERGEKESADAVQRWLRDLDKSLFPV